MEMAGLDRGNYPPIAGNDSKTLRKLSLLEARMVGLDTDSQEAQLLPSGDGSRGSENNSNSRSTIGFARPQIAVPSPSQGNSNGPGLSQGHGLGTVGGNTQADPVMGQGQGGGGSLKRKAPHSEPFSPHKLLPPAVGNRLQPGTPSTQSTIDEKSTGAPIPETAASATEGMQGDVEDVRLFAAGEKRLKATTTTTATEPSLPPLIPGHVVNVQGHHSQNQNHSNNGNIRVGNQSSSHQVGGVGGSSPSMGRGNRTGRVGSG
ncbi:unnamed protein product, partial [Choristocarpus tenellus]